MKVGTDALHVGELEAWVPTSECLPEDCSAVIAWNSETGMPCTAFFDAEEGAWNTQADGAILPDGAVTHWRHYVGPSGETSGDSQS